MTTPKKTKFLFAIFTCFAFHLAPAQTRQVPVYQTDLEVNNLKGPVKSANYYSYEAIEKDGKITCGSFKRDYPTQNNEVVFFTRSGRMVSHLTLNDDSTSFGKIEYVFNADDQFLEYRYIDGEGHIETRLEYSYNLEKKLTQLLSFDQNNALSSKEIYLYNVAGQEIELQTLTAGDTLIRRIVTTYDSGHAVCKQEYRGMSEQSYRTTYSYNAKGLLAKETIINGSGDLIRIDEYLYDSRGNVTNWSSYNDQGLFAQWQFRYNKKTRRLLKSA
jgi:hypothetical protein